MRRLLLSCLLVAIASVIAPCSGQLPAQLHDIGNVTDLRAHWRIKPLSSAATRWGIVWNVVDSANYEGAEIVLLDERYVDAFGRESAEFHRYSVRDGAVVDDEKTDFSPSSSMRDGGGSIRVRLDAGAVVGRLDAGYGVPDISIPVELHSGTGMGFYCDAGCDTLRCDFECDKVDVPEPSSFADMGELRAYLRASQDVRETEWVYYDRDTDPRRVSLGSAYRLATVSDGSGGYDVIAIDTVAGARPQLKARLAATGFIDVYDLTWYDASGVTMGPECSARFENASLLSFSFPLYKATLRFRRAIATD